MLLSKERVVDPHEGRVLVEISSFSTLSTRLEFDTLYSLQRKYQVKIGF